MTITELRNELQNRLHEQALRGHIDWDAIDSLRWTGEDGGPRSSEA